ncbi:MAG: tetratricopeptide repeat protein [Candidatus Rifleibacteriota bacterium]
MVAPISIEEKDLANQHLDRSISFAMCGKLDQAIEAAEKAVEIDPDFSQAFNKLGDYYLKQGQLQKAAEAYRKAIVISPESENSHFDLGRTLAMLAQYDEALDSLNKAVELKPDHAETYAYIGQVYFEKQDYENAVTNLQIAIQKDSENIMASYLLGIVSAKIGKESQARQLFKAVVDRYSQLINMKPKFAEGYYYIGKTHFFLGDLENAVKNLKKAVELDTEDVDYHYSFGMLYSDAEAFFALAEALLENENPSEAREYINKALELEPNNPKYQELKSKVG